MPAKTETLTDVYTRKLGGEQYEYDLHFTHGRRVEWRAEVFQGGNLKGTPGGVLTVNSVGRDDLRQSVVTLVEVTIENMIGIAE